MNPYQYFIAKFDVDGFCIIMLDYIESDFWQVFVDEILEFTFTIGKKKFFTFGNAYVVKEDIKNDLIINRVQKTITKNTGRNFPIGVDTALDWPLFNKLPDVVKGRLAPTELVKMFEYRQQLTSVSARSRRMGALMVTFLDNENQQQRFYYRSPNEPHRFDDQVSLGIGCLFALQGIPCLYYGTEQGLHGAGGTPAAVHEALWGKPYAFDRQHPFYQTTRMISAVRDYLALRHGRQYFRPISRDGVYFEFSAFPDGILAFSRVNYAQEILVVANTNTSAAWEGYVIVQYEINSTGSQFITIFSNKINWTQPMPVVEKKADTVEIYDINGEVTHRNIRVLRVKLLPLEIQILGNPRT